MGHCLQRTRPKLKRHKIWPYFFTRHKFSSDCIASTLESVYPGGLRWPDKSDVVAVLEFLERSLMHGGKLCVISGAGISTESGIPDYRSPGRPPHKPITHDQFVSSATYRRRYWARSYVGYERLSKAKPGKTHISLAALDSSGQLSGNISQNVDGLLLASGVDTRRLVELHGNIHYVKCLDCGLKVGRDLIQQQLKELNLGWIPESEEHQERSIFERPDGDYAVTEELVNKFCPPVCFRCGKNGLLKPDVVFFGGNVPAENALRARQFIEHSTAILVLGSSLSTFSAYGLVQRASRELGLPICIINYGPTRADHLATLKLEVDTGQLMFQICQQFAPEHVIKRYFEKGLQQVV